MIAEEHTSLPELTPEQKLAVAVIRSWIMDYRRYLKEAMRQAKLGVKPYKGELYKWPDTIDAEFWCMVCGGSQAQLIRYRDELWKQVEEAYKASQQKNTVLQKRATISEKPTTSEHAVRLKNPSGKKRVGSAKKPTRSKRAKLEEKTTIGKRVTLIEEPIDNERARIGQKAISSERTFNTKESVLEECPDSWDEAILEVAQILGIK